MTDIGLLEVISRVAVKPFVFSDGTAVPAGTMITVPMSIRGYDESMVPNAAAFDPFRFEQPFAEDGARKQFTSLDLAYLIFGYGKPTSCLVLGDAERLRRPCRQAHVSRSIFRRNGDQDDVRASPPEI
jgi:hypothetical protein